MVLLKPTQWKKYIYGFKIQICEQVEIKNDILIVQDTRKFNISTWMNDRCHHFVDDLLKYIVLYRNFDTVFQIVLLISVPYCKKSALISLTL